MDRKRFLVAGAGRWGKNYLRNLERHPRAMAAGLVTRQERSALPHLEPAARLYSSFAEGLRAERWDGVILATPPETHADQLRLTLAEGVPVIVEKPLTLSVAEAEELAAIPGSACVLVDHIFLFHPGYEKLKELVGEPGTIRSIISEGGNEGPFRGYSPLWDYGAHDLSMILDLLGTPPSRVQASVRNQGERNGGLAGTYSVKLGFSSGAEASFLADNISPSKIRRITVETGRDRFILDDYPKAKLTRTDPGGNDAQDLPIPAVSPLANLLEVFCEGIDGRRDSRWGLQLGLQVVRALAACERAVAQA